MGAGASTDSGSSGVPQVGGAAAGGGAAEAPPAEAPPAEAPSAGAAAAEGGVAASGQNRRSGPFLIRLKKALKEATIATTTGQQSVTKYDVRKRLIGLGSELTIVYPDAQPKTRDAQLDVLDIRIRLANEIGRAIDILDPLSNRKYYISHDADTLIKALLLRF